MKKLLIIPLLFLCGQLVSQIYTPVTPTIYGEKDNRRKVLYALHPPEKSELETNTNDTSAQIFYYKTDSTFWGWSQARGFFRIGTTFTGGGGGDIDLSAVYAHSGSNYNNTRQLFYNIDNELIDSFDLEYTTLYVSSDFLLTDTLGLPHTKLLSLAHAIGGSQGLQSVLDINNQFTKHDTINTNGYNFFIDGGGNNVDITSNNFSITHSIIGGNASLHTSSSLFDFASFNATQQIQFGANRSTNPSLNRINLLVQDFSGPANENELVVYADHTKFINHSANTHTKLVIIHADTMLTVPDFQLVMKGDTIVKYPFTGGGGSSLANFYLKDSTFSNSRRSEIIGGNSLNFIGGNTGMALDSISLFLTTAGSSYLCRFLPNGENAFQLNTDNIFMRSHDTFNGKGGDFIIDGFDAQDGATYVDYDVANPTGIKYLADYSATYTNRSLVDKAFIESHVIESGGILTVKPIDDLSHVIMGLGQMVLDAPSGLEIDGVITYATPPHGSPTDSILTYNPSTQVINHVANTFLDVSDALPALLTTPAVDQLLKWDGTKFINFTPNYSSINGTGFVKATGTTLSYDNSTYLTTATAASTYLPLAGGTMVGNIIATDNLYDLGAATATRFRSGFFATLLQSPKLKGSVTANDSLVIMGNNASSGNTSTVAAIGIDVGNSGQTRAMTIFNSGNVAIGTTTAPTEKLRVEGGNMMVRLGNFDISAGNFTWNGNGSHTFTLQQSNTTYFRINATSTWISNVIPLSIGTNTAFTATALLDIAAGTTAFAPLGLNSGPLLSSPLAGKIEFLTDAYYATITTGAARKTFAFLENPIFSGATFADATNIVFNTTTGTKIGTATSQKLSFYNSTPIVQPSGSVITALTNLGLVATPMVSESELTITDITTNNASISAHGFTPKYPNDATKFLDGTGAYTVPTGTGGITLSAIGASPNANGATLTGTVLNLEPASASFGGIITTGAQSFTGTKSFITVAANNFQTAATSTNSNFMSIGASTGQGLSSSVSTASYITNGNNIQFRAGIRGSTSTVATAGTDVFAFAIGDNTYTEATSGTSNLAGGLYIAKQTFTNGSGSTVDFQNAFIADKPSGATNNYSLNTGLINDRDDLTFTTVGKGLIYKSGTGTRASNATLVGGTVTVTNTNVTANTLISMTRKTAGGVLGNLTYTLSAGASFTINSDNALDTSTVTYFLSESN